MKTCFSWHKFSSICIDWMERPHSKNRNRKPSAKKNSEGTKVKMQWKVSINKKLKSGKMPIEVVGTQNDLISAEDKDVLMNYLK